MVGERECRAGTSCARSSNTGGGALGTLNRRGGNPAGDPQRGEGPTGDPPPEGRPAQGTHTEYTRTLYAG